MLIEYQVGSVDLGGLQWDHIAPLGFWQIAVGGEYGHVVAGGLHTQLELDLFAGAQLQLFGVHQIDGQGSLRALIMGDLV